MHELEDISDILCCCKSLTDYSRVGLNLTIIDNNLE